MVIETVAGEVRPEAVPPDFRVCAKLRHPLSSLAGKAGFDALLSRALTLAKAEFPQLAPTRVGADGCVEGLTQVQPPLGTREAAQAEIALIAHMMALLCTFLGEALALRLIQNVWPDASLNDSDYGKETTV